MQVNIKRVGVALAAMTFWASAFLPPASGAETAFRLGTSQWDPGGGDFRWNYGPSIAWYAANGYPYFGNGSYWSSSYGSYGYGPYSDCQWNWRTHVNRRGHLIATSARCY